jgi:hypothetical protein
MAQDTLKVVDATEAGEQDEAFSALAGIESHMYAEAKRFVALIEAGWIQQAQPNRPVGATDTIAIGDAAHGLTQACAHYAKVYAVAFPDDIDTGHADEYDRGWHEALKALREQTVDQIEPGQTVTREQLLHAISVNDE